MKLNKISKSFFINLDRRKDRLDHIYKNTPFFTERFPAVDSKSLELTEEIKKLFPDDLYLKKKKSEIACAISHYKLWKQLVEDKNADNYLILEDDVVFEKGFTKFWNSVWSHSMPNDYFLIFFGGCQPYNKPSYHKVLQPYNNYFNNVKKQDFFTKDDHYWHMNASSYVISKQCASLMCQWVDQKGFDDKYSIESSNLDVFMIDFVNKNKLFSAPNKLFHLNPLMARQLHEENDNIELDKNSDIRFDEDRFTDINDSIETKQNEFIKLKNEWMKFKDYNFLDFVAKNLPKREVPTEKYTCYNPGKKIGIVSLYTPEISEYAIESEISIRDYAFKQGYTFHVYRDKLNKESHPNWSKPQSLLNHFDNHETIVWMDSDTIIFNPNQKFENILSECVPIKKIIACEDIGANNKILPKGSMLNSGVVMFKNHEYTRNIITRWRDFDCDKSGLYTGGGDQQVLCKVLKSSDGFGYNRKIFPMNTFNTDPRKVDVNTFILHFMGYTNTLKSVFMRYWGSK